MPAPIKHSLTTKVILQVVAVVLVIGLLTLLVNYYLSSQRSVEQAVKSADSLISTAMPGLQAACFLNDGYLAKEVGSALLADELINTVRILTEQGALLAEVSREASTKQSTLIVDRLVYSTFDPDEYIGTIEVYLAKSVIDERVSESVIQISWSILGQTLSGALALIWAIWHFFAPRFRHLLGQISEVDIERGETLHCAHKDRHSEVGRLVSYINQLILKMYMVLEMERDLRLQQEVSRRKYKSLFESSSSAIFLMGSNGLLQSANSACREYAITQGFFSDSVFQVNVAEVLAAGDQSRATFIYEELAAGKKMRFELHYQDKDNAHWYQVHLIPVDTDTYQGVINEITELKLEAQAALDAARKDQLTGLYNRLGFSERLDGTLKQVAARDHGVAVLLIDLDGFKKVNDTHGHDAGDQVLKEVASRMCGQVREGDCVARLGGDEFVILVPKATESIVERIAQQVIEQINRPFLLDDEKVAHIGCSIGIVCLSPGEEISSRELMTLADSEMYEVKNSGKNNYRFSPSSSA